MADDGVERAGEQRPDPARAMTQLAQQMKEMADRMLGGGLPGWPVPGAPARPAGEAAAPDPGSPPDGGGSSGARSAGTRSRSAPPVRPAVAGMPPMPATVSARQMQAIVDDIAARRVQVQALVTQLDVFDEQLATLETSLQPLLQWLRTWSDLEGAVTDFWTPKPPRA